MNEELRLDCLGMKCPRPIIELAKAKRRAPPGILLTIQADDLAFESDVRAWVETTQATLILLDRDGDTVTARIKLAG